jgi:hypothetical protein
LYTSAFSSSPLSVLTRPHHVHQHTSAPRITSLAQQSTTLHHSKVIDAEFTRSEKDIDDDDTSTELSLIEYSQNQDPEWKNMPIAFCDTVSNTYIDCTLAFYAKDGDVEYALGVPCDDPIVVALELEEDEDNANNREGDSVTNLGMVVPINPDNTENTTPNDGSEEAMFGEEEKEEVFQMAARSLMEEFGSNLRLKKTPRVLTLEGNLEEAIGNWKEIMVDAVVGKKKKDGQINLDDALNMLDEEGDGADEDGEDYFDTIMKRDLGEDYMSLVDDDDEIDDEILKLFDADNLQEEDLDNLIDMLNGTSKTTTSKKTYDQLLQQLKPSAALKLLNFIGPGEKEYTILRPLRPTLLVGKEDPDDYTRRILLTEEEMRVVLPKLESVCREELENAGFFLAGVSDDCEKAP